jgi:hypothetical protein
LALVSDPVGALLQYGIAWLIEHARPLSEALDWLAGDPGEIAGQARAWRTVASSMRVEADGLVRAVRLDLSEWQGAAAEAYRGWAGRRDRSVLALARASETMALIVQGAGVLIGTVRVMVRDAVATVVSRLLVYAGELAATAGLAAPWVVGQVSALCASWAAKIASWLRDLIASLRNLLRESDKLSDLIERFKRSPETGSGRGAAADPAGGPAAPGPLKPVTDPEAEQQRIYELGRDPAVGKYRPGEAETAHRIELELGIELRRSADEEVDWVDSMGTKYDAVGNFDSRFFDREWPNLQTRITDHLDKADFVPIDIARFTPEQKQMVIDFIEERGYGPRAFVVGR